MKIALIGEAYGEEEAQWQKPFIGPAGQELNRMLSDAGINREECYVSNVFNFRPERNDVSTLCSERSLCSRFRQVALVRGLYLRDEYAPEIDRLAQELRSERPNLVVALGNTAAWALIGETAITKIRGTLFNSTLVSGLKVLPTFHPAAILRQYDQRHVAVLDLKKAKIEAEFPEIRRPIRTIWMEPTLEDLDNFFSQYIVMADYLSFDIETAAGQITCIGFAPRIDLALVIPFLDNRKGGNYWSKENELKAWRFVERVLGTDIPKVAQNGLFDIQYLWMKYRIKVKNFCQDTMLLHHSLHPESEKGLGFLGSVYTNEVSWKDMRGRGEKTIKRED